MVISAIRVKKIENTGTKLQGVASVTLDNMIVIHDIKILKGSDGMFLAMPSKELKGRTFKDIVHPINSEARHIFEKLLFAAYEETEHRRCNSIDFVLNEEYNKVEFQELSYDYYDIANVFNYEPESEAMMAG